MLDDETPVFYISARGTLYLHVEARAGAARPALGRLRRRGAERAARPGRRAEPRPARRTGGCPTRCSPASSRSSDDEASGWRELAGRRRRCSPTQGAVPADPSGRGRVLPPDLGASLDRRQRDRRRLAGPAEDDRRLVGAREPLHAPRSRTDRGADDPDRRGAAPQRPARRRRARRRGRSPRATRARRRADSRVIQLAADAFERATGRRPLAAPRRRLAADHAAARAARDPRRRHRLRRARAATSMPRTSGCACTISRSRSRRRASCTSRSPSSRHRR